MWIHVWTNSYLIRVVHPHPTAACREVVHLPLPLLASIGGGKHHLELARSVNNKVCGPVLWDLTTNKSSEIIALSVWMHLWRAHNTHVAFLTWSPKACLPIVMPCVHPGTRRGMFLQIIGSRKTVPSRMFLIVPLGLFHISFSLNSEENCIWIISVFHLKTKSKSPNSKNQKASCIFINTLTNIQQIW